MEKYFTEEQIDEFQKAFNFIDKDGDGHITTQELAALFELFGQNYTDEELRKMIERVDVNGNGTIEFDELLNVMPREENKPTYTEDQEIKDAFTVFDEDKDGYISAEELSNAMINLELKVTAEEAREMINEADADGDGLIDYEEFAKIIKAVADREFAK